MPADSRQSAAEMVSVNLDGPASRSNSLTLGAVAQLKSRAKTAREMLDDANRKRAENFPNATKSSIQEGRRGLSTITRIAYGACSLVTMPIAAVLVGAFLIPYYEKLGVKLSYVSFFVALARSLDVITDPAAAYLSDSCRMTWPIAGRRRIFLAVGALCYGIFLRFLLSPPPGYIVLTHERGTPVADEKGVSLSMWFGSFYILFFIASTFLAIPYDALGPELTDDPEERSKLFFGCTLFDGLGSLIAVGAPTIALTIIDSVPGFVDYCKQDQSEWSTSSIGRMLRMLGEDDANATEFDSSSQDCKLRNVRGAYNMMAWFFMLYCIGMFWFVVSRVKERDMSSLPTPPPVVPTLLNTLNNKLFTSLLPAWVYDSVSAALGGGFVLFWVRYCVIPEYQDGCNRGHPDVALHGTDSKGNPLLPWYCRSELIFNGGIGLLLVGAVLSCPFWLALVGKMGKRKVWLMWSLFGAVTNFAAFFVSAFSGRMRINYALFVIFLQGIPLGAKFVADSILADIIDYDEFLTGTRAEGTYMMFKSFLPKICAIPASAIPVALLGAFGHVPVEGTRVMQQCTNIDAVSACEASFDMGRAGCTLADGSVGSAEACNAAFNGCGELCQANAINAYVTTIFGAGTVLALMSYSVKSKFKLKTAKQIQQIPDGCALHEHGHAAPDPVTGIPYALTNYEDFEESPRHLLDHWQSVSYLQKLKSSSGPMLTLNTSTRSFYACVFTFLFFLFMSIQNFHLLEDNSKAIIEVLLIICFGMSITVTGFAYLRMKAAEQIVRARPANKIISKVLKHRTEVKRVQKALSPEPLDVPLEKLDAMQRGIMSDEDRASDDPETSELWDWQAVKADLTDKTSLDLAEAAIWSRKWTKQLMDIQSWYEQNAYEVTNQRGRLISAQILKTCFADLHSVSGAPGNFLPCSRVGDIVTTAAHGPMPAPGAKDGKKKKKVNLWLWTEDAIGYPLFPGEVARGLVGQSKDDGARADGGWRYTKEQARAVATQCALHVAASLYEELGSLACVKSIFELRGTIACTAGFKDHDYVMDGASNVFEQMFGSCGVRSIRGATSLPNNAPVMIEAVVEVQVPTSETISLGEALLMDSIAAAAGAMGDMQSKVQEKLLKSTESTRDLLSRRGSRDRTSGKEM